ncbi:MAG TPA: efflux RND transporter periplasmic adaptor subunit, partial [Calditrichia bacterium]|nr:efflux RND transporter periplasmic adaptor subunit [Calditrichia bacterium]
IALDTAATGYINTAVELSGKIAIDPGRLAHIRPRFPGIVKKVFKKVGDPVAEDEVLAIVESNESLAPYQIRSQMRGTIIDMHLTPGEAITSEDHDILIADLRAVWAELDVYEKDLSLIKTGQTVLITGETNMPAYSGRIAYISPVIDIRTQTATARVEINNPESRWRPGLFISGTVSVSRGEAAVRIPYSALHKVANETVVFIRDGKLFQAQAVVPGRRDESFVEIVKGLDPGDIFVSNGGFLMKAELEKNTFGDGHAH